MPDVYSQATRNFGMQRPRRYRMAPFRLRPTWLPPRQAAKLAPLCHPRNSLRRPAPGANQPGPKSLKLRGPKVALKHGDPIVALLGESNRKPGASVEEQVGQVGVPPEPRHPPEGPWPPLPYLVRRDVVAAFGHPQRHARNGLLHLCKDHVDEDCTCPCSGLSRSRTIDLLLQRGAAHVLRRHRRRACWHRPGRAEDSLVGSPS